MDEDSGGRNSDRKDESTSDLVEGCIDVFKAVVVEAAKYLNWFS